MLNYLLLLIPAGVLVGLIYLALSKTSPPALRRTALIVLIFVIVFLLALIFWLLSGPEAKKGPYAGFSIQETAPEEKADYTFVILFLLGFIVFIGVILFFGFQGEQNRRKKNRPRR
jgi:hypothetical protein